MASFAVAGDFVDDLDDDEPEAWPELAQQKLDESLRCAICQDLFTMPVSLRSCTHSCASPPAARRPHPSPRPLLFAPARPRVHARRDASH